MSTAFEEKREKWKGIRDEVLRFAWLLHFGMNVDPAEILREAARRATNDDKSRRGTWLLAEEVRAEVERMVREEPTKKRAVLLARIAERRGMKYETLRDILSRTTKHKPSKIHYVHAPAMAASPLWAALEEADRSAAASHVPITPEIVAAWNAALAGFEQDAAGNVTFTPEVRARLVASLKPFLARRRGTPPHTTPFRSSPVRGGVAGKKGAHDGRRKTPLDERSGTLSRARRGHAEEVADARHDASAPLREGVRESRALLARGAPGIRGRAHAEPHGRGPRPRRVKKGKKRSPP